MIAVVTVVAGCGSPTSSSADSEPRSTTSPGESPPPVMYAGSLNASSLSGADIRWDVPIGDPDIDWHAAFAACSTGVALCDRTRPAVVTLASATSPRSGTANPDGTIDPLLDHTLVYVITQSGVPGAATGPARSGSAARQPELASCTLENYVDARTGAVLFSADSSEQP